MAFMAFLGSNDIPITAFDDRLAHQTREYGGTGSLELCHIFTSSRHGVNDQWPAICSVRSASCTAANFTYEKFYSIVSKMQGGVGETC